MKQDMKFMTEELVIFLKMNLYVPNSAAAQAIIARLRAADDLCEAGKVTLDYLDDHFWENASIDESMTGERILTPLEKELKKAIAEYETEKP
jgi:hypothetical protein